jgi:hypothetical protein
LDLMTTLATVVGTADARACLRATFLGSPESRCSGVGLDLLVHATV